jgi:hypothetical protein
MRIAIIGAGNVGGRGVSIMATPRFPEGKAANQNPAPRVRVSHPQEAE